MLNNIVSTIRTSLNQQLNRELEALNQPEYWLVFSLDIDDWSGNSTKLVGIFATYKEAKCLARAKNARGQEKCVVEKATREEAANAIRLYFL